MGEHINYGSSPTTVATVVSISTISPGAAGNLKRFLIYYAFFDHGEKPVSAVRGGLIGWFGIWGRPALGLYGQVRFSG